MAFPTGDVFSERILVFPMSKICAGLTGDVSFLTKDVSLPTKDISFLSEDASC